MDFQQAIQNIAAAPAAKAKERRAKIKKESRDAYAPVKEPRSYRRGFFGWGTAWSAGFAVLIAILLSGTGVVTASIYSMPDNPLYSVKLAAESVQLAFTFSDVGKAELISTFNDRRVDEVVEMANKGMAAEIGTLNSRIASNMIKISELSADGMYTNDEGLILKHQYGLSGSSPQDSQEHAVTVPQTTVAAPTSTDTTTTTTITTVPAVTPAPATSNILPPRAESAFSGGQGNGEDKWAELRQHLSEKQINNLRVLLESWQHAPDWLKPVLEQAINIIIDGYGLSPSNSSAIFQLLESYGLSMRDLGQ